jgi:hypothetical protein
MQKFLDGRIVLYGGENLHIDSQIKHEDKEKLKIIAEELPGMDFAANA